MLGNVFFYCKLEKIAVILTSFFLTILNKFMKCAREEESPELSIDECLEKLKKVLLD